MIYNYNTEDKVLLAVDCIIFGFDEEKLKILLVKRDFEPEKGKWSLMGGFLKKSENLDQAANRVLQHLTGLHDIYLEQLYAFSKIDRDPVDRTLSIAYYSLINIEKYNNSLIEKYSAKWFSISKVPNLIFDHEKMVEQGLRRLRRRATNGPLGFELLPEKFTMRQLQKLYEAILNEKLDKRNFINKINSFGILKKLDEKDKESSKKGAFLYSFDQEIYEKKIEKGLNFKI